MDKPLLASELIASLSNPQRGIARYVNGKYAKAMTRATQVEMVKSQKFVLTDNLLHHALVGSYVEPKILLKGLFNAIPPFNNMWIEWNEHQRVRYGYKETCKIIDKSTVKPLDLTVIPERLGYHIQKINDEFLYTPYWKINETDKFVSPEMAFDIHSKLYNYEEYLTNWKLYNPNNPNFMDEDTYYKERVETGQMLLGDIYCNYYKKDKESITEIMGHLSPTQTAAVHWSMSAQKFETQMTTDDTIRHLKHLKMLTGDARFMISLLNILNYDLIVTEDRTPPKQVNHIHLGRKVPKNEYKLVEIDLPKPRGKKLYKQMFTGHGSPKREHWRRGHWRRVNDKRGKLIKRVWIEEQKVGDPKLGTIVHDYLLKKKY